MRPIFKHSRLAKAATALLIAGVPLVAGAAGVAAGGERPSEALRAGGCLAYRENNQYPLRRCDKGEAVRLLQVALRVVEPNLAVDGHFGVRTERALRAYEQIWGLPVVDGIVDAQTWSSLTWQYAEGDDANGNGIVDPWELWTNDVPAPSIRCAAYRADYAYPMQLCGRGEGIRVAQLALQWVDPGLAADGYFGPRTFDALIAFKQHVGLPEVGEIDEPTWVALTGGHAPGYDEDGDGIVDPWEVSY